METAYQSSRSPLWRVAAYKEFRNDIEYGSYPAAEHEVPIAYEEPAGFTAVLSN
jgi:hypothetical protein